MPGVQATPADPALDQLGRRVPQDIRVAGFDDIPLAAYFRPSLTTVRQPIAEVGVAIVDALTAQLAGVPTPAVQLPAALVVRDSSG